MTWLFSRLPIRADSWALSSEGLTYNAPAIVALAMLFCVRPLLATTLACLAWLRVVEGTLAFSVHAAVSAALIVDGKQLRAVGILLLAWTAYYYTQVFASSEQLVPGLAVGAALGSVNLCLRALWERAFCTTFHSTP